MHAVNSQILISGALGGVGNAIASEYGAKARWGSKTRIKSASPPTIVGTIGEVSVGVSDSTWGMIVFGTALVSYDEMSSVAIDDMWTDGW